MNRTADSSDAAMQPTVVARLTPPGRAAVAVLSVAGPQAVSAVEQFFHPASNRHLRQHPVRQIVVGRWGGPTGEEVVVCRLENEQANEHVEIHCHGGQQAASRILDELVATGCQAVDWQSWIDQHAAHTIEADAHKALTQALTRRGAAILLDQFHGALRRELAEIRECIVNDDVKTALPRIDLLLRRSSVGLHLCKPWQVLIAGRPNVGKSSLVNAILGYQRAIVFDQPGTTRDVLSANTAMGGWPVRLSDTAGMHDAADRLESRGIELAHDQLRLSDILVWVLDAAAIRDASKSIIQLAHDEMFTSIDTLPKDQRPVVVLNKCDLVDSSCYRVGHDHGDTVVLTSALTGDGVDMLVEHIALLLVPHSPTTGAAVPFTEQHRRQLQSARASLQTDDNHFAKLSIDQLLK